MSKLQIYSNMKKETREIDRKGMRAREIWKEFFPGCHQHILNLIADIAKDSLI